MEILLKAGFILLTLSCVLVVITTVNRAHRGLPSRGRAFATVAGGMVLWLAATAIAAASGKLAPAPDRIPANLPVLAVAAILTLLLTLGPIGRVLIARVSPQAFIATQAFRILVELALWALAALNLGPELLTFEGRNFDIVTGLTAMPVAWMIARRRSKPLIIAWNLLGLALLLNVLVHAVLSMPGPMQRIQVEPGPEIIATFPYIWLPALLVPFAFGLHVLSLRQALSAATVPVNTK